jgi:quercetin dioxygenase-like cupin family protein
LLKGLPDDRCQCPHWGYVFKGKMTARYADRDEVYEAGDAFYTPVGCKYSATATTWALFEVCPMRRAEDERVQVWADGS